MRSFCRLFFGLMILLSVSSTGYAENLYSLEPSNETPVSAAQQIYGQLQTLEQICQVGAIRINKIVGQISQVRTSDERKFFQLSYVEERAHHVEAYARYLVKLLRWQNNSVVTAISSSRGDSTLENQVEGLRVLLGMLLLQRDELYHGQTETRLAEYHQVVELYVLGNLLAIQSSSSPHLLKTADSLKLSVYKGLRGLKAELIYLDRQLEQISVKEG